MMARRNVRQQAEELLRQRGGSPGGPGSKPPETNGKAREDPATPDGPPDPGISAADLMRMEMEEVEFLIQGELPQQGLAVLAGRPKQGKSWYALNVAVAVASGGIALSRFRAPQGDVLYLALEDNRRRLRKRLLKMIPNGVGPDRLDLRTAWRRADAFGVADLVEWLTAHPGARLVVVDTLAKFRAPKRNGENDYASDYEAVGALKAIADQFGVCVLVVTHTRKPQTGQDAGADPLDEVSGSTGVTGAADTIMVLRRKRMEAEAKLFVTGRDVDEHTSALKFDAQFGLWVYEGEAGEQEVTKEEHETIALIRTKGPHTPKEAALALQVNESTMRSRLARLANRGKLTSVDGRYSLPEWTEIFGE